MYLPLCLNSCSIALYRLVPMQLYSMMGCVVLEWLGISMFPWRAVGATIQQWLLVLK